MGIEFEQRGIPSPGGQELRMIHVRIISRPVGPETLVSPVIVMKHLFSGPVVAFNAKMVIPLHSQAAVSVPGFQAALGQGDAGRDPYPGHLLHRKVGIGFNILFPGHLSPPLSKQRDPESEQQDQADVCSLQQNPPQLFLIAMVQK